MKTKQKASLTNAKITMLMVSILVISLISVSLSLFSVKLSSKCTGFPFADRIVENIVEKQFLDVKTALAMGYEKIENFDQLGVDGWSDLITRNLKTISRLRKTYYINKVLDNFNETGYSEMIVIDAVENKWRTDDVYISKIYNCKYRKLVYNSRYSTESLQYENGKKFSELKTMKEVFWKECDKKTSELEKYSNVSVLIDSILSGSRDYSITLRIGAGFFEKGMLGDFPSMFVSPKKIYSLPVYLSISKNTKNVHKKNFRDQLENTSMDLHMIIFSMYDLDDVC